MQAAEQFHVKAAPLTAMVVLVAALGVGAITGYAFGTAERSSAAIESTHQVAPQFPAATQPPVREPQNSYD